MYMKGGYFGDARVALQGVNGFIGILDNGRMFDTDDLVGRYLVEGSCSCSVSHGGSAGYG